MKLIFLFAFLLGTTFLIQSVTAQQCGLCETLIQYIEGLMEQNATVTEIEQELEVICSVFPAFQQVCDQIVEQGVPQIITWIEQNEDPQEICTQLGLCTSKAAAHPKILPINFGKLFSSMPGQDSGCSDCEYIIGVIEQWMDNTNNQQEIVTAVEIVCTYMPDWEQTCDAIIAAGVPEVIQWIETYENNTIVCTQLGMCSGEVVSEVQVYAPNAPEDDCSDCTQLVQWIENWVAQNSTENEIELYLETVCSLIPGYTQLCDEVLVAELPAIIQYLENNESPSTVCAQIGVCTSISPAIKLAIN